MTLKAFFGGWGGFVRDIQLLPVAWSLHFLDLGKHVCVTGCSGVDQHGTGVFG